MSAPAFPVLDSLIGQFEGFGKPGTPATLNNNPGNIIAGPFAESHGATGSAGNFAVFPDVTTGTAAEDALVQHYAGQNASISDLISSWAPPTAPGNSPQSTQDYINFISGKLGVPATTPLNALPKDATVPTTNASVLSTVAGAVADYTNPLGTGMMGQITGLSWDRIAAFLVGLIMVAGGLYLFKPVQETVNRTVRSTLL